MRQLLLPFCISIFCCLFVACKSSFNPNGLYILADEAYTTNYFDYNYLATLSSLSDTAEHFVMDCSLIAGVRKRKIYFSFSNSTKKYYLNDTIRISNVLCSRYYERDFQRWLLNLKRYFLCLSFFRWRN